MAAPACPFSSLPACMPSPLSPSYSPFSVPSPFSSASSGSFPNEGSPISDSAFDCMPSPADHVHPDYSLFDPTASIAVPVYAVHPDIALGYPHDGNYGIPWHDSSKSTYAPFFHQNAHNQLDQPSIHQATQRNSKSLSVFIPPNPHSTQQHINTPTHSIHSPAPSHPVQLPASANDIVLDSEFDDWNPPQSVNSSGPVQEMFTQNRSHTTHTQFPNTPLMQTNYAPHNHVKKEEFSSQMYNQSQQEQHQVMYASSSEQTIYIPPTNSPIYIQHPESIIYTHPTLDRSTAFTGLTMHDISTSVYTHRLNSSPYSQQNGNGEYTQSQSECSMYATESPAYVHPADVSSQNSGIDYKTICAPELKSSPGVTFNDWSETLSGDVKPDNKADGCEDDWKMSHQIDTSNASSEQTVNVNNDMYLSRQVNLSDNPIDSKQDTHDNRNPDPDTDMDAEGEPDEDIREGGYHDGDEDEYIENVDDDSDGDYVLRTRPRRSRGRIQSSPVSFNVSSYSQCYNDPSAYGMSSPSSSLLNNDQTYPSSAIYQSEGRTLRPRRYNPYSNNSTSSSYPHHATPYYSNGNNDRSVSSMSTTGQGNSPKRRARPGTSLPVPVPVPNLTKKSRGRRVPTVASLEDLRGAAACGGNAVRHVSDSVIPVPGSGRRRSSTGIGGRNGRVYLCEVAGCGKCFARGEHLKRHVRSIHTYEKPHRCPYPSCGKDFSRHDNLGQHMRVHKDYVPPLDS